MPKYTRNTVLLAKLESTPGSDANPTGASDAIAIRNFQPRPLEGTALEREQIRAAFGNNPQILVNQYSEITFEVELAGSGDAGTEPVFGPLLESCGLDKTVVADTSVTYAPVTPVTKSVSIYLFLDGVLHKMIGCRGSVAFELTNQSIPFMRFTMRGTFVNPTDTNPTGVAFSQIAAVPVNPTNTTPFTIFTESPCIEALSIDLANTLERRDLINCTPQTLVTARNVGGSLEFEMPSVAAWNVWAAVAASSLGVLSVKHGQTAGNIVTLASSYCQLSGMEYTEASGGVRHIRSPLRLVPSSGNDELSVAFT